MSTPVFSRRRALAGVTTVGLALPLLSACGEEAGSGSSSAGDPSTTPSTAADPTADPATEPSTEPGEGSGGGAAGVVATTAVPVGSGVIIADSAVVVTQPTEGDIHVFSTTCTHTGCPVTGISDRITCPCHGSTFDLTTGDVLSGPASAPLPAVDFTVDGDQVVLS